MPGFVKGKSGEKLWSKAKRAAGHADADNKYAFANWWFHKQREKGKKAKRRKLHAKLKPYKGK